MKTYNDLTRHLLFSHFLMHKPMSNTKKIGLGLLFTILLYIVGPTPSSPVLEKPLPEVPVDLSALEAFVQSKEAAIGDIRPGNASRIVFADSIPQKTPYSVVYFHGFPASSEEGAPFHTMVAKSLGANLYLPRLYGHGRQEKEPLLDYTADAFLDSGREALAIAKSLGEKVIVLATSNGATLALTLGNDPDLAALGLYSPNIKIKDERAFLLTWPWGLQLARLIKGGKYNYMNDITPEKEQFNTTFYRLEALLHVQKLVETAMTPETFAKVKAPVFMGYYYKNDSLQDDTVRVADMLVMFDQLGTPDSLKRKKAFPEAKSHVITSYLNTDVYGEVAQETMAFLRAQLPLPTQTSDSLSQP